MSILQIKQRHRYPLHQMKIGPRGKNRGFRDYDEDNGRHHEITRNGFQVKKPKPKDIQLRIGKLY